MFGVLPGWSAMSRRRYYMQVSVFCSRPAISASRQKSAISLASLIDPERLCLEEQTFGMKPLPVVSGVPSHLVTPLFQGKPWWKPMLTQIHSLDEFIQPKICLTVAKPLPGISYCAVRRHILAVVCTQPLSVRLVVPLCAASLHVLVAYRPSAIRFFRPECLRLGTLSKGPGDID